MDYVMTAKDDVAFVDTLVKELGWGITDVEAWRVLDAFKKAGIKVYFNDPIKRAEQLGDHV